MRGCWRDPGELLLLLHTVCFCSSDVLLLCMGYVCMVPALHIRRNSDGEGVHKAQVHVESFTQIWVLLVYS